MASVKITITFVPKKGGNGGKVACDFGKGTIADIRMKPTLTLACFAFAGLLARCLIRVQGVKSISRREADERL